MNLKCLLGHDYRIISNPVPIRESEFDFSWEGPYALGECSRCKKREMRPCYGRFTFAAIDGKKKKEWFKILNEEYLTQASRVGKGENDAK